MTLIGVELRSVATGKAPCRTRSARRVVSVVVVPPRPTAVTSMPGAARRRGKIPTAVKGDAPDGTTLQEALVEAEKAVAVAQQSVELISTLPSAYPPHPAVRLVKSTMKRLLMAGGVFAMVYLLNSGTTWLRYFSAVAFPTAVSLYSLRKGSLSPSGAVAASLVGFGTFLAGFRCVTIVLSFFISSSALTKFKEGSKAATLADHKTGGQRDWVQVFSNGFFATLFCVLYAFATEFRDLPLGTEGLSKLGTFMFGGVLGNYAWTNGGVTWLGLFASLAGGLFVGVMCYLGTLVCNVGQPLLPLARSQLPVIGLGLAGGLVGSVVDSLLGATLQFSGYDMKLKKVVNRPGNDPDRVFKINGIDLLSNNQINLISSLILAVITGYLSVAIFD